MTKNRYIAHIVIEADTPLKVGSNTSDFIQDAPVQKDWNGLPMILGTSIAGVLRKDFSGNKADIFGEDKGSKVIISNALLCINGKNEVCEELLLKKSDFLKIFDNLPIREHTAINSKGVTTNGAKFDEEVVYKGIRFKFSIEFIEENKSTFEDILNLLKNPAFRLGGGSTKGFGKLKIIEIKSKLCDLENYSSSLNDILSHCEEYATKHEIPQEREQSTINATHTIYTLKIKPDDFFMFGSGFGDGDADMTPVYEKVVDYKNGKLGEKQVLIPASSIKGALAHRTTYHYNLQSKLFIGNSDAKETIKEIFGEAKNSKQNIDGSKGKLLISDCFKSFDEAKQTKTFDHVSIDRFTGGGIDGALFQEKTVADNKSLKDDERYYEIEILLEKTIQGDELKAFENSLDDICNGMLPLGGATTKGHGVFSGKVLKDGVEL
jgi:CRISPR/Cas system CMR subunit Cmr4 (Cas7 group RAMP superfamily)